MVTERAAIGRIEGRRLLDGDDVDRLEKRIDAQRRAQQILGHFAALTRRERDLVELVDLNGLTVWGSESRRGP